jgi:hypothetical protein
MKLTDEGLRKTLSKVWQLGQTYWQQADSDSYKQQDKSDETRKKYLALVEEASALLAHPDHSGDGSEKCFKCGHAAHADSCVNVAPVPQDSKAWRAAFNERHEFDVYPDHFMTGLRNEFAAGWQAALASNKAAAVAVEAMGWKLVPAMHEGRAGVLQIRQVV